MNKTSNSVVLHRFKKNLSNFDIVFGRGSGVNALPGNLWFRGLVNQHRRQYHTARKGDKLRIARSIVDLIQSKGGWFVEFESSSNGYKEVTVERALEKTSQALREHKVSYNPRERIIKEVETVETWTAGPITTKMIPQTKFPSSKELLTTSTRETSAAKRGIIEWPEAVLPQQEDTECKNENLVLKMQLFQLVRERVLLKDEFKNLLEEVERLKNMVKCNTPHNHVPGGEGQFDDSMEEGEIEIEDQEVDACPPKDVSSVNIDETKKPVFKDEIERLKSQLTTTQQQLAAVHESWQDQEHQLRECQHIIEITTAKLRDSELRFEMQQNALRQLDENLADEYKTAKLRASEPCFQDLSHSLAAEAFELASSRISERD